MKRMVGYSSPYTKCLIEASKDAIRTSRELLAQPVYPFVPPGDPRTAEAAVDPISDPGDLPPTVEIRTWV